MENEKKYNVYLHEKLGKWNYIYDEDDSAMMLLKMMETSPHHRSRWWLMSLLVPFCPDRCCEPLAPRWVQGHSDELAVSPL